MRLSSSILLKAQQVAAKDRDINAKARDTYEESAHRCQQKALDLGLWAGNTEARTEGQAGRNKALMTALGAITVVATALFPPAGLIVGLASAAILYWQATQNEEGAEKSAQLRKDEGQEKLCGDTDNSLSKRFDDRSKNDADDIKLYLQRTFEHARRDYENGRGEK